MSAAVASLAASSAATLRVRTHAICLKVGRRAGGKAEKDKERDKGGELFSILNIFPMKYLVI